MPHSSRRFLVFAAVAAALVLLQLQPTPHPLVSVTSLTDASARSRISGPRTSILHNSRDSVRSRITLPSLDIRSTTEGNESYHRIRLPGSVPNPVEGAPSIPVISRIVAIPRSASVAVRWKANRVTNIEDINVYPTPRTEPDPFTPGSRREVFYKEEEIYSTDALFPEKNVVIENIGYLRGQRLGPSVRLSSLLSRI